jgi:GPI inositol-deacylase
LFFSTVDLNEEYSGFFGPVLEEQTQYVEHCIKIVLKLYKQQPNASKQVVLIGHSMVGTSIGCSLLKFHKNFRFIITL